MTSDQVLDFETKRRSAIEDAEDSYVAGDLLANVWHCSELAGIGVCLSGREQEAEDLGPDGIGYTDDGYIIAWGAEERVNGVSYRPVVLI